MGRMNFTIEAVLTGDLVGASEAEPQRVEQTMAAIEAVAAGAEQLFRDGFFGYPAKFERIRGDGWQLWLSAHWWSLRMACMIFARLKAADLLETRIAIGHGRHAPRDRDGPEGDWSLAATMREAFRHSGRALDGMKRDDRLAIAGPADLVTPLHEAVVLFVEAEARRWTAKQAQVLVHALRVLPPSLHETAEKVGLNSPQAVASRLAPVRHVRAGLEKWEAHEKAVAQGGIGLLVQKKHLTNWN